MKIYFAIFAFLISGFCFGQHSDLNALLASYAANIKTDNTPFGSSCLYYTNYITVSKNGSIITMSYGFGGGSSADGDLIERIVVKFDLRTATICNGYWYKSYGSWQHLGNKNIVSISDSNGIEMTRVGAKSYNYGKTSNYLPEKIQFDLGSEPLANRVVTAFLSLQEGYKDTDEWLLPIQGGNENANTQSQPTQNSNNSTNTVNRRRNNTHGNTQNQPKKSKSGRYGE